MSTTSEEAAFVETTLSFFISNYCANAGSSLVVYEYINTLGREVDLFWNARWTGAAVLFFFNRYLSLILNLYGLASNAPISDVSCPAAAKADRAIDILQYLPWAAFSALRAFALSKNRPIALLIFCLSIVPIGINFSHFAMGLTGVNLPLTGCLAEDNVGSALSRKFTIASRTCLITADLLLICLTWSKLYGGGVRYAMKMNGFIAVFLRDGTIYFVVLLILNTLHLTLSMLSVEYAIQNVSYVTQFSEPITTVLISRFLLHLQSANRRSMNCGVQSRTLTASNNEIESVVFERVLGSLASRIKAPGEDDYDFEDSYDEDKLAVDTVMGTASSGIQEDGQYGAMEMSPVSSPSSDGR